MNFEEAVVIRNYAPSDVVTKIVHFSLAAAVLVFVSMLLNNVAGGHQSALGASIIYGRGSGVARNDNKGPDEYYAPRYRNGQCVEDEGNTLVAEPALGGAARRMEGKPRERAMASLCRKAAL
jgi:hypothetical protein